MHIQINRSGAEHMAKLNAKQKRFVDEYLIDLNATQAAIRAGYSQKTAVVQGSRLLTIAKVAEAVSAAQAARSKRTLITQDRVISELVRLGFSDLRKVLTPTGSLLNPDEWDDDTAAAIASIEVITNAGEAGTDEDGRKIVERTHKIKVWDKNSALEKLAKHLGMYAPERHEHTGKDGKPLMPVVVYQLPDNGRG